MHSTLVHQCRKISNFFVTKRHPKLGLQPHLKLHTFGPPVQLYFSIRPISDQFFKLGRILPHRHVSLLYLQEFHLLLPFQVCRKIFLEEFSLEGSPRDDLPFGFHLPSGHLPPVLGLLYEHVSGISPLLSVRTIHGSKDPL
ncbi:hypothetical protein Lalb_Chr01g0015461 [Lupinus albus]|uniref:Uncharacterized protein n=1 Tax=Lupinus albus TaxID=3870 RepID=A0A6A4R620_LUPAL|nr:hypothetical protein Lalb_Chr01g0015461 [Lupinus albus]